MSYKLDVFAWIRVLTVKGFYLLLYIIALRTFSPLQSDTPIESSMFCSIYIGCQSVHFYCKTLLHILKSTKGIEMKLGLYIDGNQRKGSAQEP